MEILKPYNLDNLELKNRIIFAPMGYMLGNFGPKAYDYFIRRAEGGAAMLIIPIHATEAVEARNLSAFLDEDSFEDFKKIIDGIHKYNSKACIQIVPGYGAILFDSLKYDVPVSASAVPSIYNPNLICHELTKEEIESILKGFRDTLGLVKKAGADAVEIHAYGGYLTDQFLTYRWNKRKDEYGGDIRGRARFLLEMIKIVKEECGENYPLFVKYSPAHYMEGEGYRTIEEGIELSKILEEAGVHVLHVDAGTHGPRWYIAMPPIYQQEETYQLEAAKAVKKAVNLPVAADGRLGNTEKAEAALKQGKLDLLIIGRGLLADPDIPNKLAENRFEDIIPCIACNEYCIGRVYAGENIQCVVNPETGREAELALSKTNAPKKILIIGGGPGGMSAAIDAARIGHDVEIWEKSPGLGGLLKAAGRPVFKLEINCLKEYYRRQIIKLGIKLCLGKEATAQDILAAKADAVILATGSKSQIPQNIPGIEGENIVTAIDAILDLCKLGERLAIIGAGLAGCEAALHLTPRGKKIDLIEMQAKILPEPIFIMNEMMLSEMIYKDKNINVHTESKLLRVGDKSIEIEKQGKKQILPCDTVILAMGMQSENSLYNELKGKIPLYAIGDCLEPRRIGEAVTEGRKALLELS